MKKKIRDCTFEDIRKYVLQQNQKAFPKDDFQHNKDKFNIKIMMYNASSLECICGLPTNDARSTILQGDSDIVLEQEIEVEE